MESEHSDSHDSLDFLDSAIELGWDEICSYYDVASCPPSLELLFRYVDLSTATEAAESVVANMLLEVIEKVDRFSPWYTRSARDFGLTSVWNCETKCHRWVLTIDAYIQWVDIIQNIHRAIEKNAGMLQGMMLVENLMNGRRSEQPDCVVAHCQCSPPRFIKINTVVLEKAKIICDACLEPFAI